MAQQKRVTQKIATAMRLMSATDEPQVTVPQIDKADTLTEIATQGIAAVNALAEERNKTAVLSANLYQQNTFLLAKVDELSDRARYANEKSLLLLKANARLIAHLQQARDLFSRIASEISQANVDIEQLAPAAEITDNPAICVDAAGLPVTGGAVDLDEPPLFDQNGMPYAKAHSVSPEKMTDLIRTLTEEPPA